MKTIKTILALSLIALSAATFADETRTEKKLAVPAAPNVLEAADIEAPQGLRLLKAKSALVPVADFVWGEPSVIPAFNLAVPAPPVILNSTDDIIPESLAFIKAKNAGVPVAPFVAGEADAAAPEIAEN